MIEVEEARRLILNAAQALGVERLPLTQALGRVLAADVVAPRDFPEVAVSAMDGYAVTAGPAVAVTEGSAVAVTEGSAVAVKTAQHSSEREWVVSATVAAGSGVERLEAGTVARIFTGAPLPEGADAVIIQENATRRGDRVSFSRAALVGENIRAAGRDLRAGSTALRAGQRLGPGALMLASSLDAAELSVARRPRVALLCTGDELRGVGEAHRPGLVVESNGIGVASLARAAGATVLTAPRVPDTLKATTAALGAALADHDLVVTIGGASVGDRDHVRAALQALGAEIDVAKVRLKPGKPLLHARLGARRVLGLPGNPASALVTFALFGVPLLRAMQGDGDPGPRRLTCVLAVDVASSPDRAVAAQGVLREDGFAPHNNQASGAMTALGCADGFVILPPSERPIAAGTLVPFVPWTLL